jgi:hypothetical protein
MSDSEPKTKMISLRLSDADYAVLKAQYRIHGARNISDLARLALQQMIRATNSPTDFAVKLADLENRVNALESEISALLKRNLAET